jgi:hypothetical protein
LAGELQFSTVDYATTGLFCGLATALFVVPLLGLHDRIQREKASQRAAAGEPSPPRSPSSTGAWRTASSRTARRSPT